MNELANIFEIMQRFVEAEHVALLFDNKSGFTKSINVAVNGSY